MIGVNTLQKFHRIKKIHLTFAITIFSLVVTITLAIVSLVHLQQVVRTNLLQSIEFNLQLVSEVSQRNIASLNRLILSASVSPLTTAYLLDDTESPIPIRELSAGLSEDLTAHPLAYRYAHRLIVTDSQLSRRVQVGFIADRIPLMSPAIPLLFSSEATSHWTGIKTDPLSMPAREPVLYKINPVYLPGNPAPIGFVYLSISTNVIPLSGYRFLDSGNLYVQVNNKVYRVTERQFVETPLDFINIRATGDVPLNAATEIFYFQNEGRYLAVKTVLGDTGITLIQTFPRSLVFQETYFAMRLFAIIFIGVFVVGVFLAFNQLSKDMTALMESRIDSEKRKRDLEYKMLQNQVNPHFLYNTLNSIKWMASIQKADGIAQMTTSLGRLLKSFAKIDKTVVPLRQELSLLEDYFIISNYRYGGSITFVVDVSEEFLECNIPIFTLQPIVENAIFHGIEANGGVGTVKIGASPTDGGNLEITVEDDGVGMDDTKISKLFEEGSTGSPMFQNVGIRNVHTRIQYEFGVEYGLRVESELGKFTRVTAVVPPPKTT